MLQKTQADEIASALNILNSRAVLERAAERVGAKRIVDDLPSSGTDANGAEPTVGPVRRVVNVASSWVGGVLQTLRLADPTTDLELAVRRLQRGVSGLDTKGINRDFDHVFGRFAGIGA